MHRLRRSRIAAGLRSLRSRAAGDATAIEARLARDETEYRQTRERLDRLEALVEGLQDAMHRESARHEELIEDLQRRTDPAEIARALSEDARRRGLS